MNIYAYLYRDGKLDSVDYKKIENMKLEGIETKKSICEELEEEWRMDLSKLLCM